MEKVGQKKDKTGGDGQLEKRVDRKRIS